MPLITDGLTLSDEIIPTIGAGPINDWNPWGAAPPASVTRIGVVTATAGSVITGLLAPPVTSSANGTIVILECLGDGTQNPTSTLTLTHQDPASVAVNQFFMPQVPTPSRIPASNSILLPVGGEVMLIYFSSHPHWFVLSQSTNGYFTQVTTPLLVSTTRALSFSATINLPAGVTNDLALTAQELMVINTDPTGSTLTGLVLPTVPSQLELPQIRRLWNVGVGALTLKHQSGLSTPGNKFWLPGSTDYVVASLDAIEFMYYPNLAGWVKAA